MMCSLAISRSPWPMALDIVSVRFKRRFMKIISCVACLDEKNEGEVAGGARCCTLWMTMATEQSVSDPGNAETLPLPAREIEPVLLELCVDLVKVGPRRAYCCGFASI